MEYLYTTAQGKTYPIKIGYKVLKSKDLVFDYERITSLCRSCGNFNNGGGCPPLAPEFSDIVAKKKYSIIIYAKLESKFKSKKVKKNNNYYIHYRFQDIILSNLLTNLGYEIKESYDKIIFLNNGFCMGCSGKCNFKKGNDYCLNPEYRTYSLEATGVDVEKTLREQFDITLKWYNKENYNEIEYMVKAIGLFYNDASLNQIISNNLIEHLNNLKSTKYQINSSEYQDILTWIRQVTYLD